jgi:hypothetical protein
MLHPTKLRKSFFGFLSLLRPTPRPFALCGDEKSGPEVSSLGVTVDEKVAKDCRGIKQILGAGVLQNSAQ